MKDLILRLWMQNWSSGAIASELGITRGAVMGMVNRAQKKGLIPPRREPPKKVAPPKAKQPDAAPLVTKLEKPVLRVVEEAVKPVVPPPPPEPESRQKTIMELGPFDCRWIRPDKMYCGKKALKYNQPWCEEHYKLVYVKGTGFSKRPFRFRA